MTSQTQKPTTNIANLTSAAVRILGYRAASRMVGLTARKPDGTVDLTRWAEDMKDDGFDPQDVESVVKALLNPALDEHAAWEKYGDEMGDELGLGDKAVVHVSGPRDGRFYPLSKQPADVQRIWAKAWRTRKDDIVAKSLTRLNRANAEYAEGVMEEYLSEAQKEENAEAARAFKLAIAALRGVR